MSFDRMDYYSSAYPGGNPFRRTTAFSSGSGKTPPERSLFNFAGRAAGDGNTSHHNWWRQWGDKAAIWGSQDLAAVLVNEATTAKTQAASHLSKAETLKPTPKTYSEIFHLGTKTIPIGEASWSGYAKTVRENFKPFKSHIQPANAKNFFKDVSFKRYVTGTLGEKNFKPIKDVLIDKPNQQWGTAAFRTLAAGVMGYDVLKHTHDAYSLAKAKEDGSLKSKWHTFKESGAAFCKYTFRDGATWEMAGVGAAIGKAAIPIALGGGVSVGGIAVGALAGLCAQRFLDKTIHTGEHDPVQQQKKRAKEAAKLAKEEYSPFRVHAIKDSHQNWA